jgi:hypothetical protein
MRRRLVLFAIALVQAALVLGLVLVLRRRTIPLGVPGEWTWSRLPANVNATAADWRVGIAAVALYVAFALAGFRALSRADRRPRAGAWLLGLAVAAPAAQIAVQCAAPDGFGLHKWAFALHAPGSNGYFTVARTPRMADVGRFLREYPEWIKTQDSLHIGTHPPGLFLVWRGTMALMRARPELARLFLEHQPPPVASALRIISRRDPLTEADRAAIVAIGLWTLLACAWTALTIYGLARVLGRGRAVAWSAATLWPIMPSALLFQPAADAAFPLLSTLIWALAARSRTGAALAAGALLAVGMQFTLAFLAVGLITALIIAWTFRTAGTFRVLVLLAGVFAAFALSTVAFGVLTGCNPLVTWWYNQANHARFYREFPRGYVAWQAGNLVELLIGLGLPVAAWLPFGLALGRADRLAVATLIVMGLLQLSGRNLGEVARLWLPLMPPLLVVAAAGAERLGAGWRALGWTLSWLGLQALAMQATIQVVYEAVELP